MSIAEGMDRRGFCAAIAASGIALGALAGHEALADEAATDEAAAPAEPTWVYVTDRLVAKPGDGEALMKDYLEFYAPYAEACGAQLVSTRVAPPMWLSMDTNTLEFTWKVAGIGGCWGIASPQRGNADVVSWWAGLRERVVDLDRSYFADPADFEELNYV